MTTTPDLVTEIFRYEIDPKISYSYNMWAFHTLAPDTSKSWNVCPFSHTNDPEKKGFYPPDDELDGPKYREAGIECRYDDDVQAARDDLEEHGYTPIPFVDLPKTLRYFVTHQQAPLGWHGGLDNLSPDHTERVTVWVRGELPS